MNLCAAKQPGATVEMLTYDKSTTPVLKTMAEAFNKQYGGLSVRTSKAFHDRFIVVDGAEYFHVGSSIKTPVSVSAQAADTSVAQSDGKLAIGAPAREAIKGRGTVERRGGETAAEAQLRGRAQSSACGITRAMASN